MTRLLATIVVVAFAAGLSTSARADAAADCFGEDNDRRIDGCTALIELRDQSAVDLSHVYAMRALAYFLKGLYSTAIRDYDVAIDMQPDFAVALNNRAWAYFRWGKAETGLPDVEKALQLNPTSPHSLDTRAHIRQALGDAAGAVSDYEMAMRPHYQTVPVRTEGFELLQRGDRRHPAAGGDRGAEKMRQRQGLRSAAAGGEVPIVAIFEAGFCAKGSSIRAWPHGLGRVMRCVRW